MRSVLALVSLIFATTSLAVPALEQRQESCVPSLASRFAFSASRFDHNETIPLVLRNYSSGPPAPVTFLTTGEPDNTVFRLENARIIMLSEPFLFDTQVFLDISLSGSAFRRRTSRIPELEPFCAQHFDDTNTTYLGVSGDIHDFALCECYDHAYKKIVYKPSASNASYIPGTCVRALVRIHKIGSF